jgi:two-component system cell cycle response regulator
MTGLVQPTPSSQQADHGASTHICLLALNKTEDALIRRVINFASTQGKSYCLQHDVAKADIIIADTLYDFPAHHAVEICIGQSSTAPIKQTASVHRRYYLSRPLLVTRIMRLLDQVAAALPPPEKKAAPSITTPSQATSQIVKPPKPTTLLTAKETPAKSKAPNTKTTPYPPQKKTISVQETQKTEIKQPTPSVYHNSNHDKPKTVNKPKKVYRYQALVVDDSAAIRKQLELELAETDIFAEFAESGEQAIEKSDQKLYDLVFLDIILPEMDGYAVCRHMRANPKMKKTPIIMLSGKTSPMDEVKGVIAGASTYLTKPIKHDQFQTTLKRVSRWLSHYQMN